MKTYSYRKYLEFFAKRARARERELFSIDIGIHVLDVLYARSYRVHHLPVVGLGTWRLGHFYPPLPKGGWHPFFGGQVDPRGGMANFAQTGFRLRRGHMHSGTATIKLQPAPSTSYVTTAVISPTRSDGLRHIHRSETCHLVGMGAGFTRATPLSEGPQSKASNLIARPARSTQIL